MLMCTKRGGCQKLDGHGGDCGRWDSAEMDWAPLDKREDMPAEDKRTPDAVIADLRARAVAAISHEATDALNAAADTLESTAARLMEAEQVIAKCDPIVDEARGNLIRIEGEWGSGRSFEDLLIQRDEEATGIQEALDALNAYRAATTGADNER